MREDSWLDDVIDPGDDPPRRSPRGALVLAVAAAPWLVVAALLVLPRGAPAAPGATPADTPAAHSTHDATGTASHDAAIAATPGSLTDLLGVTQLQGGWRSAPGADAAVAIATIAARSWLVEHDPQLAALGATARLAVEIVPEAVEQVTGDLVVVTLLATDARAGASHAGVRRVAMPVWLRGTDAQPAGAPWWLPEPALVPTVLAGEPVGDAHELLAASEALHAAGYVDVEVLSLERTDSWPYRAQVRARTPDGRDVSTPVLLRRHLGGFAVAGTVTRPAPPWNGGEPPPDDRGPDGREADGWSLEGWGDPTSRPSWEPWP